MAAPAPPAAAPLDDPMDQTTGGDGHNPKPPPGPGGSGIRVIDAQSMHRQPRSPYGKNKPSAPPSGPSFQSIIGPAPGGPPPKGPGPGPSPPPPAIGVTASSTKNPAEAGPQGVPKRVRITGKGGVKPNLEDNLPTKPKP